MCFVSAFKQVTVNISGDSTENIFANPMYNEQQQAVEVKNIPADPKITQVRADL